MVTYSSAVVSLAYAGKLGAKALSTFSLARAVTNVTGFTILLGVTGPIDTLATQAHGASEHAALGIVLQRALVVTLACWVPLAAVYLHAAPLLTLLGEPAGLSARAGRYVALFSPVLALHGAAFCVLRYLIAQGEVFGVLFAGVAYLAATGPLNELLVVRLGLGLDGSALASVAADAVYLLAMIAVAVRQCRRQPRARKPWTGFSREAFSGLGHYVSIAVPCTGMVVADQAIFDLTTALAGALPSAETALAAFGVVFNVNSLLYMAVMGLAYAVATRVGNALGARAPGAAKLAAEAALAVATLAMACVSGIVWILRDRVVGAFTDDPDVSALAVSLLPPMALSLTAGGGSAVLMGVLRGTGRQQYGVWANLGAKATGLALEVLLAFRLGWGAVGLWWGLATASVVQTLALVLVVASYDWHHETRRAGALVRRLSSSFSTYSDFSRLELDDEESDPTAALHEASLVAELDKESLPFMHAELHAGLL